MSIISLLYKGNSAHQKLRMYHLTKKKCTVYQKLRQSIGNFKWFSNFYTLHFFFLQNIKVLTFNYIDVNQFISVIFVGIALHKIYFYWECNCWRTLAYNSAYKDQSGNPLRKRWRKYCSFVCLIINCSFVSHSMTIGYKALPMQQRWGGWRSGVTAWWWKK